MTQKEILLKHLKDIDCWIEEYKLRAVNTPHGWIGSSGDRRIRELAQEGIIERRMNGRYAEMRFKTPNKLFDISESVTKKDLTKYL